MFNTQTTICDTYTYYAQYICLTKVIENEAQKKKKIKIKRKKFKIHEIIKICTIDEKIDFGT